MDEDLEKIIRGALDEAQTAGRDVKGQTDHAAAAIRDLRPDLSAHDALNAINIVHWFLRPQS